MISLKTNKFNIGDEVTVIDAWRGSGPYFFARVKIDSIFIRNNEVSYEFQNHDLQAKTESEIFTCIEVVKKEVNRICDQELLKYSRRIEEKRQQLLASIK